MKNNLMPYEERIAHEFIRIKKSCNGEYKGFILTCPGINMDSERYIPCPFFEGEGHKKFCNPYNIYNIYMKKYGLPSMLKDCLDSEETT
jgi:hypothetical protein